MGGVDHSLSLGRRAETHGKQAPTSASYKDLESLARKKSLILQAKIALAADRDQSQH